VSGAAVSNSLRGHPRPIIFQVLAALPGKSSVSHGTFISNSGPRGVIMQDTECNNPYWQERGSYYVGFRFNTGAGPQYGWVRIRWGGCKDRDFNTNDFIVKDYAWGDVGDQIKTGQRQLHEDETQVAPQAAKKPDAAPVTDSKGSLSLLALGAVGLQAWRKSRRGVSSAAP
jgi:hypothetical protein